MSMNQHYEEIINKQQNLNDMFRWDHQTHLGFASYARDNYLILNLQRQIQLAATSAVAATNFVPPGSQQQQSQNNKHYQQQHRRPLKKRNAKHTMMAHHQLFKNNEVQDQKQNNDINYSSTKQKAKALHEMEEETCKRYFAQGALPILNNDSPFQFLTTAAANLPASGSLLSPPQPSHKEQKQRQQQQQNCAMKEINVTTETLILQQQDLVKHQQRKEAQRYANASAKPSEYNVVSASTMRNTKNSKKNTSLEEAGCSASQSLTADGRRKWKKPKGKPKRPLSAYNLFFQYSRESIVSAGCDSKMEDMLSSISSETVIANIMAMEKKKRQDAAVTAALEPGMKKRRKHRKTHGKISFKELAKTVGQTWKSLDLESKSVFEELAKIEKEQYMKALEVWEKGQQKH